MTDWQLTTPVAFLIFNRPETTRRVFAEIAKAKPPKLLVVADGARLDKLGEAKRVTETRAIIDLVDWGCEVLTDYSDVNLGCKQRVSSGIDWVFEQVEEAIILEDDILPLPSFFRFCEELLNKYRNNPNVMVISGCNLISNRYAPEHSYFFSKYNHIWGWATWRRAWKCFDITISNWPKFYFEGRLHDLCENNLIAVTYWHDILDSVYHGRITTCWDYQWAFTVWSMSGIAVRPSNNLTFNIGFGSLATHTVGKAPAFILKSIPMDMSFPLKHPVSMVQDKKADYLTDKIVFKITYLGYILRKIKKVWLFFLIWCNKNNSF